MSNININWSEVVLWATFACFLLAGIGTRWKLKRATVHWGWIGLSVWALLAALSASNQ